MVINLTKMKGIMLRMREKFTGVEFVDQTRQAEHPNQEREQIKYYKSYECPSIKNSIEKLEKLSDLTPDEKNETNKMICCLKNHRDYRYLSNFVYTRYQTTINGPNFDAKRFSTNTNAIVNESGNTLWPDGYINLVKRWELSPVLFNTKKSEVVVDGVLKNECITYDVSFIFDSYGAGSFPALISDQMYLPKRPAPRPVSQLILDSNSCSGGKSVSDMINYISTMCHNNKDKDEKYQVNNLLSRLVDKSMHLELEDNYVYVMHTACIFGCSYINNDDESSLWEHGYDEFIKQFGLTIVYANNKYDENDLGENKNYTHVFKLCKPQWIDELYKFA